MFDLRLGILLRRYTAHTNSIGALAVDEVSGVILSCGTGGDVLFWRDRNHATVGWSHTGHLKLGNRQALPNYYRREFYDVLSDLPKSTSPTNASLLDHMFFRRSSSKAVREARLARWVQHRWMRFLLRSIETSIDEATRGITSVLCALKLLYHVKSMRVDPTHMTAALLSRRSTCRIVDYSIMPAKITHRLFHGKGRGMSAVAMLLERNFVVCSDVLGMVFLWLTPPGCHGVLLSAWFNKCLVNRYSHPNDELRDALFNDDERMDIQEGRLVLSKGIGVAGLASADCDQETDVATETTTKTIQGPLESVPVVTSLWVDPIRAVIITGDDVGFVSLWEYETVYRGAVVDRVWPFPYPLLEKLALLRLKFEKFYSSAKSGELMDLARLIAHHPLSQNNELVEPFCVRPPLSSELFSLLVQMEPQLTSSASMQAQAGRDEAPRPVTSSVPSPAVLKRRFSSGMAGFGSRKPSIKFSTCATPTISESKVCLSKSSMLLKGMNAHDVLSDSEEDEQSLREITSASISRVESPLPNPGAEPSVSRESPSRVLSPTGGKQTLLASSSTSLQ